MAKVPAVDPPVAEAPAADPFGLALTGDGEPGLGTETASSAMPSEEIISISAVGVGVGKALARAEGGALIPTQTVEISCDPSTENCGVGVSVGVFVSNWADALPAPIQNPNDKAKSIFDLKVNRIRVLLNESKEKSSEY
jgi:hypothetical protein